MTTDTTKITKSTISSAANAVSRLCALYRRRGGDALQEALALVDGTASTAAIAILGEMTEEWHDHAIACVFAVLMPSEDRKRLGAYFTPPHLVDHLLDRFEALGVQIGRARFRDPSAGGAAFVVPLARRMVRLWIKEGIARKSIAALLCDRLQGCEIDPSLATLAQALFTRMLIQEFGFPRSIARQASRVIKNGDGLEPGWTEFDHEIGNPPYRRLNANEHALAKGQFPDITAGRMNLYALFTRKALAIVPIGGLVGHVIPASFVGGPEFARFRRRISELAEVLVLDSVEKRTDVFLDAIQDACFIVLRRRPTPVEGPSPHRVASSILTSTGCVNTLPDVILPTDGSPWLLPGEGRAETGPCLNDLGWTTRAGYLVANRQPERLHNTRARGRYPLIWAASVTPDGHFDYDRGRKSRQAGNRGFVQANEGASYVITQECVVLQRTSSSSQEKRLNAAVVTEEFIRRYGGVVGENHVIILLPTRKDAASAANVAALLNSKAASVAYNRVGGSASISSKVLATLPLPPICPRS
ncbi:Eco57I restriction-modification methylase domain-containing protein [Humitalea sp. 24SJ18S-53]|uniref:Eco57I restriction-modification methylase domain-containing protein n=1 Tax=Humitalea sp. 24SJ18S-53 TaxID=3422307 RepID=UPI003D66EBB6